MAIAPFAGLHFVTDRLNIDLFASVPGPGDHDMRMRTI